jgi:NhaP-type Na+/H+ or K+/H+ antiporter
VGLCFGLATRKLIKWLRHRGAKPPQELAVSLAMAYLTFYIANLPLQVSGVTAVVVLGLYGSASGKWMMSPQVAEAGYFFSFWDTISYAVNGLVFFFAGASAVNFFIRSAEELSHSSGTWVALQSFWRLPGIYVAMFLVRGICIAAFMPFFTFIGSWRPWTRGRFGYRFRRPQARCWTRSNRVCGRLRCWKWVPARW